eukprot:TRINITY_DN19003_c0_g1_i1.p1 TRINITY_DN19003_c0_g1~~TRINITY_DN19003_c0_g1_i1.p1  ORF type:complete len:609 (+),score=158.22 TRINITY_DN19003_c0_g1_i1:176-2002(+)
MAEVLQGYSSPPVLTRKVSDSGLELVHAIGSGIIRGQTVDDESTLATSAAATPAGGPGGTPLQYDVSDAIEAIGFGRAQVFLMFLVSAIWVADAMEMMMLSFLTPALACEWNLHDAQKASITTVVFIGMGIGAPFWGWFDDKYGRKKGYFLCVVVTAVAGLASAASPGYWMLLLCRGWVGFGASGSHVCVTLFSEFLPTRWRAFGVLMVGVFWAVGALLEAGLAFATMPNLPHDTGWRVLLVLSAAPLFILITLYPLLPESPRWDALNGNLKRATATLEQAARRNKRSMPPGVLVAQSQLHEQQHAKVAKAKIKDLFKPQLRLTTMLLLPMWFVVAMSYYGVVLLNTELFQEEDEGMRCSDRATQMAAEAARNASNATGLRPGEGCSHLKPEDYRDALIDAVAEVPGLFLCFLVIDTIGRKGTLGAGFVLSTIAFGCLMACWTRPVENMFIFFARGSVAGLFQVIFLYTPEVYPTSLRARAIGLFSAFARLGGMLTPFVSDVIMPFSSRLALGIYAGLCLTATMAAFCLPIETAGRQIQEHVGDQPAPVPSEQAQGTVRYSSLAEGAIGRPKAGTTASMQSAMELALDQGGAGAQAPAAAGDEGFSIV